MPIEIIIGDFGLSKLEETKENPYFLSDEEQESSLMNTICGTPLTMAPEMYLFGDRYDKTVDIWSFGVVMFQLYCGVYPFQAKS